MGKELEQYLKTVEELAGARVLVIGDIILDHYIWGSVDRISPEAPVVVVSVNNEEYRAGGAGNVASNLRALGASVELFGIIGQDSAADRVIANFNAEGIGTNHLFKSDSRPTIQKSRVIASSQQVVRVDWEEVGEVGESYDKFLMEELEKVLPNVDAIVCSDYGKGALASKKLFDRFSELQKEGKVGIGKVPVIVDPKAPHFSMYTGATMIKPNKKEASEASGVYIKNRADALEAAKILKEKWQCELVLITLGELGMVLYNGSSHEIPTVARDVYDVSGAGDTVSAIIAGAMAVGAEPELACHLANYGAGVVVSEVGTVAVTKEQLIKAVHEFNS